MDPTWRTSLWQQFGAAIDMLDNALRDCPDELWAGSLWQDRSMPPYWFSEFWYIAYHTLFFLDLYLSGSPEGFAPPAPFTLDEPERLYTRAELQNYLMHNRDKCQVTIEALTDERARHHCQFNSRSASFADLLLYNMRHVQEHATQLNMFLGQQAGSASRWVGQAKDS